MLRANLLQPLSLPKLILDRQELLATLLAYLPLLDTLQEELTKFRNFEQVTATFIQTPKERNVRGLRHHLAAVYSLSRMCSLLAKTQQKLQPFLGKNVPVVNGLLQLLDNPRLTHLRDLIESKLNEDVLSKYESGKTVKRNSLIFLFKASAIENSMADVHRTTYSHTLEDILHIFKGIQDQARCDQLKLLTNDQRGYYLRTNKHTNLQRLAQLFDDELIQIGSRGDYVTFSTSLLASLNNRLKQCEN